MSLPVGPPLHQKPPLLYSSSSPFGFLEASLPVSGLGVSHCGHDRGRCLEPAFILLGAISRLEFELTVN